MSVPIREVTAREILDSRGRPTVAARVEFVTGAAGIASVPSGASTGTAEAHELRDGDPRRYRGLGCRGAVAAVRDEIAPALRGRTMASQAELDGWLAQLDGTPFKSRLGANAILAVSLAFARACAAEARRPLHGVFADLIGRPANSLPRMTVNLFSGGKHAGQQVAIQDVLVVPLAPTIAAGLAQTYEVYQCAAELVLRKYGMRILRADEGGLAPPFPATATMLADAVEAIERAGFHPGTEVALAVDVAASHFHQDGRYRLDGQVLDSSQMIDRLAGWVRDFPVISVEDGLAEDDWENWPALCQALAGRALVLGDDFLCTNAERVRRAVATRCATALLLKVNQVGTLTEAAQAWRLAREAEWQVTVSARSGETEDDWLADLAVAWGQQIKVGSITQSERLAKYNRLLEIEEATGWPVTPPPAVPPSPIGQTT